MNFEPSTVKGFQDYLPPESLKRNAILKIAKKNFKLFGFQPVETPIIEFEELMRSDSLNEEDEAVADRFRLKDRGNRNLGLRYEFTFQFSRLLKENPNIKLPFKSYQIGPAFRDEPIRQGRARQFTQCDIDILGDQNPSADAECIAALASIFKTLKIKTTIQVNNRKLLNAIIESVQIGESKQVLRELDKLNKLDLDTIKANLRKYATTNQIVTLLKLLEKDLSFFKENAFTGAEELGELIQICKLYGLKLKFNPSIARGLSYYTGNIFEFTLENKKTTLAAGGRYDKSVGRYLNRDIPAVGASFSLEALSGLCEEEINQIATPAYPTSLLISFNQDKETIQLARKLRKSNISCSIAFGQPSKALDYADSLNIPYVIFLGKEEIEKNKFKLKNMKTGDEKLLSEKQLINKLDK